MPLALPYQLSARYELTAEIGRGGNAVVYRALDHALGRAVAVKLLREDTLSADTLTRFRQEVQVTARLEHAHLLHVYDTGLLDDRPYVVMELATGRTLADRLHTEGQLPVRDALEIARGVGLALGYAHAHDVVHRDVKPENVLLANGRALLADFGIARVLQSDLGSRITSTGMAVGTVLYMSPEQLCAERDIDGRSDQYSLACVLYEMLAGVRPHVAATVEGLRVLRTKGEHAPVRSHRPSVPDSVDAALRVALSPMPADRFGTMEEFVRALDAASTDVVASGSHPRLGAGAPVAADAPTFPIGWRPSRTLIAASGLAVALVVGAITWIGLGRAAAAPSSSGGRAVRVLAVTGAATNPALGAAVVQAVTDELRAWPEVSVVDGIASRDSTGVTLSVSALPLGDSASIRVDVGNANDARHLVWVVPARAAAAPGTASTIVRHALGGRGSDVAPGIDAMPGRSLTALAAYVRGWTLLRAGTLDSAQTSFHAAAEASPGFAQAALWAAQSGAWRDPGSPSAWKDDAERAALVGALHGADSLQAAAVRLLSEQRYPEACEAYRGLADLAPQAFTGWYGLGECLRLDNVVLSDGPRLRFRSSVWSALASYRSAVLRAPSPELLAALFDNVMNTTFAAGNRQRHGGDAPTARPVKYAALPSLDADTLAFVPIPFGESERLGRGAVPLTYLAALRRGRAAALDLTALWVRTASASPDAWFFRARALELAGAFDTSAGGESAGAALDSAVAHSRTEALQARIAVARTRLALRRGDFGDAAGIARRAITGRVPRDREARRDLAALAALVGDAVRAAALLPAPESAPVQGTLADSLRQFRLDAQIGACAGLAERRRGLEAVFATQFAAAEVAAQRVALLQPAYREAVPCLGPGILAEFEPIPPIDRAYRAIAAGNLPAARAILAASRAQRAGANAAAVTWDFLFAESWALRAAGDTAAAVKHVVDALQDIAGMNVNTLDWVAQAAGMRRAVMMLRDAAPGDERSRAWAARTAPLTRELPSRDTP